MKLAIAQIIAVLASIAFGEAGQNTGDVAYIEAGILALGLAFVLMLATSGLEIVEWLRERSLSQGKRSLGCTQSRGKRA
ncbi:hypothetical protein ALP73_200107 [Pseudomonas coronafaciens pv. garcae]|uniref:Uncharacterized protein n=3 Tax=Pseudomonas syringae group TaxID=136849 RepID=A0AB37QJ53_9PSED|nr:MULTISPECIES: hypothetical protein [Pseudomonas syringae group]KPW23130.1 hypothetical protein ALO83_103665 [Pseudomonas cannabina pv. alisalensis]KPY14363.1 hypothetical protein ALO54_200221 [Pseudomonas syringae pv. philadelphi]MBN4174361.1 hypothetical protein [Pseudomonas savastanoi pv. phaseolicola]RMN76642.1 hypothetical protein ALQ53_200218 [Pseudomonas cannabina]RMN81549.1 hypothetical protein ALQ52_104325 [Pseudomonas cannabina pv. alisalensis]